MITTSHSLKTAANAQFAAADYSSAISTYDKALSELPSYLEYELAVLQSNIAACWVKMGQWKEAMEACERGLEGLEREMPTREGAQRKRREMKGKKGERGKGRGKGVNGRKGLESDSEDEDEKEKKTEQEMQQEHEQEHSQVVELPSDAEDDELEQRLKELNLSDSRKRDITRIRTKLLLRRARARSSITPQPPATTSSWAHLAGALEDYTLLSTPSYFSTLPASDQKTVRQALVSLPPRVNAAKEKEMGEMMGKLKELGNGILKPFGLSTDMFKMTQGSDGGWSMSVDQQGGGRK